MRQLRILPAAEGDLAQAAEWYEIRRPGLGLKLLIDADHLLQRVAEAPLSFALWRPDQPWRKALLGRFPYAIFFRLVADELEVVAVAHTRRRPGFWIGR